MDKRRLLQFAFTGIFILFLLLIVAKFRPRFEAPKPLEQEQLKRTAEGTLSARGFTYKQETAGKVDFTATAEVVTEDPSGVKLLTNPVVTTGTGTKAWGKRGTFNPIDNSMRIWEDAHLSQPSGWVATSTGFRLTPEGEVVSESRADLRRGELTGTADLMRYNRQTELAHLEGKVHFIQGPKTLDCASVDLDLQKHDGVMVGPVVLTAEEGTLKAPAGKILLDEQNNLKTVDLGTPAAGDGPRFACAGSRVVSDFGKDGQISRVVLTGDASVTSKGEVPSTVHSDHFDLTPEKDSGWAWVAPGALTVDRDGGTSHATSGKGSLGGKTPETADLAGPVYGSDPRGDFKGDRATMLAGDWTLVGHAEVTKPAEWVTAERITFRKDGSSDAEGDVKGWRSGKTEKEPETRYSADKARTAAGGYPSKLTGNAVVIRGGMTLKAPSMKAQDERSALAEGGDAGLAEGTFVQEGQGTSTVTAPTIRYVGQEHRATAEGQGDRRAVGVGKDYTVTGDLLRAVLDAGDRPQRYEAEGNATFVGALYDGTGDVLTYDPATQMGRAVGRDKDAVVVQKNPYRRLAGPVVDFAPKHLEVQTAGSPRRGFLEGVKPPEKKKESEQQKTREPGKKK
jgi:lipopolysaccharide export system protein LptA